MSEFRKNPLNNHYVLISGKRGARPFSGHESEIKKNGSVCFFCPGNEHLTPPEIMTYKNGTNWDFRTVPNKFPAVDLSHDLNPHSLSYFDKLGGYGTHEVLIDSPNHEDSFFTISASQFSLSFKAYKERISELRQNPNFVYIQIFKNHGLRAGASLEHTHSQLMAIPIVPPEVSEKQWTMFNHFERTQQCLMCELIKKEQSSGERILFENEFFIAQMAYAAKFPYEIWIVPKFHAEHFHEINDSEIHALSEIAHVIFQALGKSLNNPAFNFYLQTAPFTDDEHLPYHWYFELFPKIGHVAGFEWSTGIFINSVIPEDAAIQLKEFIV